MSEQRSWDSNRDFRYPELCKHGEKVGPAVRIVEWREEWPPQDEVPHAGTRWHREHGDVTVADGIPYEFGAGWYIHVVEDSHPNKTVGVPLVSLKPIPPKPETASGEVVGTIEISRPTPSFSAGTLHGPKGAASIVSGCGLDAGTYKLIRVEDES